MVTRNTKDQPQKYAKHRWEKVPGRLGERSHRCLVCDMTRAVYGGRTYWLRERVTPRGVREAVFVVDPGTAYPTCDG